MAEIHAENDQSSSEALNRTLLVCLSLVRIITWMYSLGLALLLVFHKGKPHLSLLKNGPEVEN